MTAPDLARHRRPWLAVALLAIAAGCAQLLDAGAYHVVDSTDGGPADGGLTDAGCWDPSGLGGLGCFACAAKTRDEYLNGCTQATCSPFANAARLTVLLGDGGLPPLPPPPDAGAPPDDGGTVVDAGTALDGGTPCSTLSNPVYVAGSSAIKPFLARLAPKLLTSTQPITVVYASQGSCVGVAAIVQNTPVRGSASYWSATGTELSCDLDPAGQTVDVGASDVFATTCLTLPGGLPANVTDSFGPVQAMTLVVPSGSQQHSISAEALYFVYGFGSGSGVAPWTNESVLFRRNATSGTQNLIAHSIGVPAAAWKGTGTKSSADMRDHLLGVLPADANAALGILSSDYADEYRAELRVLAFQDHGQRCAFTPDSTPSAHDKLNVRDGHYPLWGPVHLLTRVSGGIPVNPAADATIGYLAGTRQLAGVDLIAYYAQKHLIPTCAMRVTRTSDSDAPTRSAPAQPCHCFFDNEVSGSTTCHPCTGTADCPADAPNCSFGYCEK